MSISGHIKKISESEKSPIVVELLEILQRQSEEIQLLKDEIARLKGQKPKPKIKPSNLDKETDKKKNGKKKKKRRKKRSKTKNIVIHEDRCLHPKNKPAGSTFIDYQDFVVQDIILMNWNIRYRRGRWQTPSGKFITAELPDDVNGHFGSGLISFALYQNYGCHVTQPLILEQLRELDVDISSGHLNNILIKNKDMFHQEKGQILTTGLTISNHINVDDTGARHKGKNGYCTHIGNEYFAWFESTKSKSRINFLKLLRVENNDFILNSDALEYMSANGFPQYQLDKLVGVKDKKFDDDDTWLNFINSVGIISKLHVRIATEGSLVGSITHHGFNKDLAIISDDAGQFNVFLHGLCWVHAERSVHKLVGFTKKHQAILKKTRTAIWQLYRDLKAFRIKPNNSQKISLENRFDKLFTQKTGFATLDLALKRIHNNKKELLLVLDRPDIPLHNNLSESDIREYVKKRKISGSTRSDTGKKCRDTFTSLKKTCRKLEISFWKYLDDRIRQKNKIPPLEGVMKLKALKS
jgi:hypothetical protein